MKFNNTLLLTEAQVKKITKGYHIKVLREKKWLTIGMKPKNTKENRIKIRIAKLKEELATMKKKG